MVSVEDRADGIHFGTGEDMSSGIFRYLRPEAPTIVNEPEAQWHMSAIMNRRPSALNVWRASPKLKPADMSWDAHAYSREVFNGLDAHHDRTGVYPTDILLLNELNLNTERGEEAESDTDPLMWPVRYRRLARFLDDLRVSCEERARDRGFTPRWWFPGWAPGHGEYTPDIAKLWVPAAKQYDGVVLHAYRTVEQITETVLWYAQQFGMDMPFLLGEWNTGDFAPNVITARVEEERRIRQTLRYLCERLPNLQACYFIYRWAEDPSGQHDIVGWEEREKLWADPMPSNSDEFHVPEDTVPDDMTAAMMGGQTLTAEELHAKRWQAHAFPQLPSVPGFNPDAGFEKAWRTTGAWWGSPLTVNEDTYKRADGTTAPARVFTNVVVFWDAQNGATVLD